MNSKFTLHRFRMTKVPPDCQFSSTLPNIICADPDGMPFVEGQAFYIWLIDKQACQPVTATTYLKSVLQFLTFLWFHSPPLHYTAAVVDLRGSIESYLKEKLGCVIRPHREGNLLVVRSKIITRQTTRLHLTALKRFYDYLIEAGKYPEPNPLNWGKWQALQPQASSTLLPAGRLPSTWFCVTADEWQPKIMDDPGLPQQLVAGMTHRRDQIIVRMLFESGARINEILSLTVKDWRDLSERRHGALTINKGSGGQRVKEIWWSSDTTKQLYLYLNENRCRHDPFNRQLETLSGSEPLFLTETGRAYRYPAFYYHWQQSCLRQGVKLHPHQARHWFVTMALRRIAGIPDETVRDAYRQGLIVYMHWKSPDTIQAYDHHLSLTDFGTIHAAISQLVQEGQAIPIEPPSDSVITDTASEVSPQMWSRLCDLFTDKENDDGNPI